MKEIQWEHVKFAKELSMIYPIEHPKRKQVEATINTILKQINQP